MLGLRPKLALAFGGVLTILLIVSATSLWILDRYSRTLDRFLYENYRSVGYANGMNEAIDELETAASIAMRGETAEATRLSKISSAKFEKNLQDEFDNVTLPGEAEAAKALRAAWQNYVLTNQSVIASTLPVAERERAYTGALLEQARVVKQDAQSIARMNLENMVREDGEVKVTAASARTTMIGLFIAGTLFAVLFVAAVGRSLLQPLRSLTKSAREIEGGNLDLIVKVRGHDEVGQLAEAFNAMAAKLREFRRSDRAKLVRTQRATQLAVRSLPDAVALVSAEGLVELANDTAQRLFGLKPDTSLDALSDHRLRELYRRARNDAKPVAPGGYDTAIQIFDERGVEKFFLPQAIPIVDGDVFVGVTLVLADVTNLRKLDEMKSGLLSVVSHELKTPLTSIRMAAHLLLDERVGSLTAKQTELLVAARDDSDRLHSIIENLLEMGRIESGREPIEMEAVPARRLIDDATAEVVAAYRDKGVDLDTSIDEDLPDVRVDSDRIGHVFTNLLTNALRYTPSGGVVRIYAESDEADSAVRFTIEDSGIGIAAEHLPRIFDRFFRVPGQPGRTGSGLGLAISREIVEAHHGTIGAQSVPGEGSRLSFTLPGVKPFDGRVTATAARGDFAGVEVKL